MNQTELLTRQGGNNMTSENDFYEKMWAQKAKGQIIEHNDPLVAISAIKTELDSYVTTGEMTAALADMISTTNFETVVTKDYIASMDLIVGDEIIMGANATMSSLQITGTQDIPIRSDIRWGNLADIPTDLLTQTEMATALTEYVTTGAMTIALSDTITSGNFNTIITKDYIASMNLIVGDEILMGANAIISLANLSTESQTNLTGADGATGDQGVQGETGSQGIQGLTGPDGTQYYTWLKYADTPTSGMDDLPAGKLYMGFALNKTSSTESDLYGDYSWSLIKGEAGATGLTGSTGSIGLTGLQGEDGLRGIEGPIGPDGQTTYFHVKYSNYAD